MHLNLTTTNVKRFLTSNSVFADGVEGAWTCAKKDFLLSCTLLPSAHAIKLLTAIIIELCTISH